MLNLSLYSVGDGRLNKLDVRTSFNDVRKNANKSKEKETETQKYFMDIP